MPARRWLILLVWVLALLAGYQAYRLFFGPRTFDVRGRIVGFGDDSLTVIIAHEEIPGYMPAMTMPFRVRQPEALRGLHLGDPVAFRLVVTRKESWIENLRPIPETGLSAPLTEAPGLTLSGERPLREGDTVPGDITLVTHADTTLSLGELRGRAVILTFIYTRCPLPEFCPLMTERFKQLYPEIKTRLGTRAHLLTVSFDTAYDTPERLRDYIRQKGIPTDIWTLASGTPEEVGRLASLFQVVYMPENTAQFIHNLVTVVIGPDGRVRRIFRGNRWSPEDVLHALETL